jgi:protein PhnA
MSLERELHKRSGSVCELSGETENLKIYEIPKSPGTGLDSHILISQVCLEQIEDPEKVDVNHWRCLNDSMWSEVLAVQVMAWRMLHRLKPEGWPQDYWICYIWMKIL